MVQFVRQIFQLEPETGSSERSVVTIDEPTAAHFVPTYRSGTAARLAGIPVETLRVWERRYGVVGPGLSPRGHRLYATEDVSRLALIKQLVDLGTPIGSIATLPLASLRQMRDAADAALARRARPGRRGRCKPFGSRSSGKRWRNERQRIGGRRTDPGRGRDLRRRCRCPGDAARDLGRRARDRTADAPG